MKQFNISLDRAEVASKLLCQLSAPNQLSRSALPQASDDFEEAGDTDDIGAKVRGKHACLFNICRGVPLSADYTTGIALENGADEDEAIAALLHDVMEDQNVTKEELTDRFGPAVTAIVAGCSDSASTDKAPWRERKEAYIAHILTASRSVRLVSSCDKLHNARAILADYQQLGEALWGRFNAGRLNLQWYYQSLVAAFQQAQERQEEPPSRVLKQLAVVVAELDQLTHEAHLFTYNECTTGQCLEQMPF